MLNIKLYFEECDQTISGPHWHPSYFFLVWKPNCLITNILQNVCCEIEMNTGLEQQGCVNDQIFICGWNIHLNTNLLSFTLTFYLIEMPQYVSPNIITPNIIQLMNTAYSDIQYTQHFASDIVKYASKAQKYSQEI